MKRRMGFVSNSSSSSFCIYGVAIEESKLFESEAFKNTLKRLTEEKNQDSDETMTEDEVFEYYGVWEILEYMEFGKGMGFWSPEGYGKIFVGRSWSSIDDDQTGKQFKEQTESILKEALGGELKFDTHQEAYYG